MNHTIKKLFAVSSISTILLLTACGGGGGGGATKSQSVTATPPTGSSIQLPVTASTTVPISNTAPPTPTYAAGSEELSVFNYINNARTTCGFGSLRQNTLIDTAATNHASWQIENDSVSHYEVANTPGFTGVDPGARFIASGYNFVAGTEVATGSYNAQKIGYGVSSTKNLFAAPYHLLYLLSPNREVGISVKSGGASGSGSDITAPAGETPSVYNVTDMASNSTFLPQVQASGDILTYPCQGATNVSTQLNGIESPSPILNRNYTSNPIGQPIIIQAATGNKLVITTVSLATTSGSIPWVIATTLTSTTDMNYFVQPSQAIAIPDTPLIANTQYTATIQGTNNGALFVKTFTFTTGS